MAGIDICSTHAGSSLESPILMHVEVELFVLDAKIVHPEWFVGVKVLEFGSLDMNGSVRGMFAAPEVYVGVDWREGKGVDVKSLFHEFVSDEVFDVFISLNTFEHDPYWKASISTGLKHLGPGGAILIACGGPGMQAHEATVSPSGEHYENIPSDDMRECLESLGAVGETWTAHGRHTHNTDTFFVGTKRNI